MVSTPKSELASELSRLSAYVTDHPDFDGREHLLERTRTLVDELRFSLRETASPVEAQSAPLAVESFGHFRIIRGEFVLSPCPAQKAVAVFRFMLMRPGRAAHKEELADALWSGIAAKDAMHSLHVAVSTLRSHLKGSPEQYVLFEAGRYVVSPFSRLRDETRDFLTAIHRANEVYKAGNEGDAELAYDQALTLYRGDFCIENLDYIWAVEERERLLAEYLTALYRVGRIRLRQRRYEDAIEVLRMLSARECYREDVHYLLMVCYLNLGRRSDAVRQFDRCRRHLANDLSLTPAPKLQSLYQLITSTAEIPANIPVSFD